MNIANNNFITELGLEGLSPEDKIKFLTEVGQVIMQGIILRVLGELSENDKDELDRLIGEDVENADDVTFRFFEAKVSNLEQIIQEEVNNFREQSKSVLQRAGLASK